MTLFSGVGETFRGTTLGMVDSLAGDSTKHDEIARKGKAEVQEGMATMAGRGVATQSGGLAGEGSGAVGYGSTSRGGGISSGMPASAPKDYPPAEWGIDQADAEGAREYDVDYEHTAKRG